MTFQIDILNPKATKLLKDLADLNLISIRQNSDDGFMKMVAKLRKNASADTLSLDEITREVEKLRAKRYEAKKK